MIRHLDNFYIPDRKEASMKKFLESATWNVAFHLNPTIPHLDEHGAKKLGEKYLLHVQRHLFGSCPDNHYAKLALLMEYSAQDLWHYHGFGYVTSQKKEKRLLTCGKQVVSIHNVPSNRQISKKVPPLPATVTFIGNLQA